MHSAPTSARSSFGNRGHPDDGRVFAVGRGTIVAAGLAFTLLAVWGAGSLWYVLFRDRLAARLIADQATMQYAYEDKVGVLRARLDRIASQKLLEQDSLENRVSDLIARQAQLENRQAILTTLAENTDTTASTGTARSDSARSDVQRSEPAKGDPIQARMLLPSFERPAGLSAYAPVEPKPKPAPDAFDLRLGDRPGASDAGPAPGPPQRQSRADAPLEKRLAHIERSMNQMEAGQFRLLAGFQHTAQDQVARIRSAVGAVGLDPNTLAPPGGKNAVGGPFVPLTVDPKAGPFEALVGRVQSDVIDLGRLRRVAVALPFGRPMPGDPDLTSGFGYRADPFTHRPALHTGLDFRAEYGAPVRATAGGKVVTAEYSGGYGNMVEIDHGNGVSTRYGHLSSIAVAEGQTVPAGAVLGRVGATGRATGPHLHYETRIDGEPVNPQRFLRAGTRLAFLSADRP